MNPTTFDFYTINAPIIGVKEDLLSFLNEFSERESPRFSTFAQLWREKQFIHLINGRQTQRGLKDVLECIFYHLVNFIGDNDPLYLSKIGSLYLLHAFYAKQPVVKYARINVTLESWSSLTRLAENLLQEKHWDAYYIFRQLCVWSAFNFCANSQDLYPGAPLHTRSDVILPSVTHFLTRKERLNGINAKHFKNQPSNRLLLTNYDKLPEYLQSNWPAIDVAINQYNEAKLELNKIKSNPQPTTSTAPIPDELDENLLYGPNLVKYPDTLQPISKLIEQFSATIYSMNEANQVGGEGPSSRVAGKPAEEDDIGKRRQRLRQARAWKKKLYETRSCNRAYGSHIKKNRPDTDNIISPEEAP